MSNVERVLTVHNRLGEGPVWSVDEQALYWVDIVEQCFWRLVPATGVHERIDVGVSIGVLALRTSGGIVMATRQGFAFWEPETRQIKFLVNPEEGKPYMRFNDGAVDCMGRFWAGSMLDDEGQQKQVGTLYRLDPDGSVQAMEHGVGIPNGIGWSPDNRTMYFTDSMTRTIYAYDFSIIDSTLSNRRVFVSPAEEMGSPDGLCMDEQGYIWSACWDGAKIVRYDPQGNIERIIEVAALRPTSCIFGGPKLNELYITSSAANLSEEQLKQYPYSGDLLRLRTEFRGLERYKFGG